MPIRKEDRPLYRTQQYRAAKAAVRDRARDLCERCGVCNNTAVLRTRRIRGLGGLEQGFKIVHIHCGAAHRNNIAGDDRLENMAWWCQRCHPVEDNHIHAVHAHETRSRRKDLQRPLLAEAVA